MNYSEQLLNPNWIEKRQTILIRDRNTCQNCNNSKVIKEGDPSLIIGYNVNDDFYIIYNLKTKRNLYFKINIENYKYNKATSVLCFCSTKEKTDNLIAITSKFFKVERQSIDSRIVFEDDEKLNGEFENILYNKIYKGDEAKIFLSKNLAHTLEWKYVRNMNIHHAYYQNGLLAWEYPNKALLTLCWSCHEELHKNTTVPELNSFGHIISFKKVCTRCFGAGWISKYSHIENGICFKCSGERFL